MTTDQQFEIEYYQKQLDNATNGYEIDYFRNILDKLRNGYEMVWVKPKSNKLLGENTQCIIEDGKFVISKK